MEWTAIRAMRGEQVDALDALALRAAAVDEVPPKLYWPLLARNDPGVLHLLGHDGDALVVVASSFCFGPGALEFTCLVDPAARGRGRCREALARLGQLRAQREPASQARLRVPAHLDASAGHLRDAGAQPVEAEHTMVARAEDVFALALPDRRLILRDAGADDAGLLAALDAASFGTRPDRTAPRFRANLAEDKRRVWIAERDGVPVGKLHARRDRDGVWVHDLCTDPDVRRLGLGREMVLRCTRRLLDGGLGRAETAVWLEVRTDNAAAVATYARCAFETVRTDTMLELSLEAFISALASSTLDAR